ncbi:hypothetical protein [Methanobrevibacter sp. TMH8]|nr:hypothetical protein [Methanobrevibacter sp. TMH8]
MLFGISTIASFRSIISFSLFDILFSRLFSLFSLSANSIFNASF